MTQLETTTPDEFDTWIISRPKWLQTAAVKLFQKPRQDSDFFNVMADLCHGEASGASDLPFETLPIGIFGLPAAAFNMRLDRISNIRGLNAIQTDANLLFGENNLTIIFGANGVGKSGFARLLKHACGARHKSELLSNVFDPKSPPTAAQFLVTRDSKQEALIWTAGSQSLPALRYVSIFDSASASEYVTNKNEASYETRRLRFISALISVCDSVSDILTTRIEGYVSKLPSLPVDLSQSPAAGFLSKLTHRTQQAVIERNCSFTDEDKLQRVTLESTLAETNVDGKLQNIRNHLNQITASETTLSELKESYNHERLKALFESKIDADIKRQAANDAAQKVFSNAPLEGIGSESWRELWKYARLYSEKVAYKGTPFPALKADSHCVLCQQTLSDEARIRLGSFEEFVTGSLESEAKNASDLYEQTLESFIKIPTKKNWEILLSPLNLAEGIVDENFSEMVTVHSQLSAGAYDTSIKHLTWSGLEEALAQTKLEAIREQEALIDSQDQEKRAMMQKQLLDLRGREWLAQQKAAIEDEVTRKGYVSALHEAIKLTKTNALTTKKNELVLSELSQGYQDRFAEELQLLGGKRIPVEPVPISQGKGKVSFQVKLKDAATQENAHSILSEGEHRIVALAAFLADMRGLGFSTPFVFDDPISSLDQDYEERVVARLVDLAKDRQVIVFTHRLSLVTLLQEAMSHAGAPAPHIESLLRIGSYIGVTDTLKIRHQKPQQGFSIMQKSLVDLRALETAGDLKAFETKLHVACTDFRIQLEKTVETFLLNEIVLRFRRSLQTHNRLNKLLAITVDDINLIENMMTKYSSYEHSQSDELPAQTVPLEELAGDIQAMISWIAAFKKK